MNHQLERERKKKKFEKSDQTGLALVCVCEKKRKDPRKEWQVSLKVHKVSKEIVEFVKLKGGQGSGVESARGTQKRSQASLAAVSS